MTCPPSFRRLGPEADLAWHEIRALTPCSMPGFVVKAL